LVAQRRNLFGTGWLKASIVLLVLVLAFTLSYRYEQRQNLHQPVTDDLMEGVKRMMEERVPLPQPSMGKAEEAVEEGANDAGSDESAEILVHYQQEYEKMKTINEKLIRRVDDLELQLQVKGKRR
jgi:hypothetical protein